MDPKLLEKFILAVNRYNLIEKGDKVLIGLSGGPDSVFLLRILLETRIYLGIDIACVHINHLLRGDESYRDENFCRRLCESHRIPLFIERVNVREFKLPKESLEEAARRVRFQKFYEIAQRNGFNKIALAHTASDMVESFFINLLRGAGIWGLRGIPVKRDIIIRPLIYIYRDEIIKYLDESGFDYVIDSTNLDTKFLRNAVRLRLIPLLEELRMGSIEKVRETTEIVNNLINYLDAQLGEIAANCLKRSYPFVTLIDYTRFAKYHSVLQELFLHKHCNLKYDEFRQIFDIIMRRKVGRVGNYKVYASAAELCFVNSTITINEELISEDDFPIVLEDLNFSFTLTQTGEGSKFSVGVNRDTFPLLLRGFRAGDKVEGKKVSSFFDNRKIPAWKRNFYPVLQKGTEIFWIPGIYRKDLGNELYINIGKVHDGEYWIFDN